VVVRGGIRCGKGQRFRSKRSGHASTGIGQGGDGCWVKVGVDVQWWCIIFSIRELTAERDTAEEGFRLRCEEGGVCDFPSSSG
jgi:hypothetical protein